VGAEDDVNKAIKAINDKIINSSGGGGGDGGKFHLQPFRAFHLHSFSLTDDKPREVYVPPEPSNDEATMFGAGISAGINFDKFDAIDVSITGNGAEDIKPIQTFNEANLRDILTENVVRSGYTKPTPIQKFAIPIVMKKRDLMGCAQTGSGKTAAFILPILDAIMNEGETAAIGQPQALIVAPTRELVIQIFDEARKFANRSWVKICLAYGGTASRHQGDTIARGCHVLVATPGRLMDFVGKSMVTFESLKFLVLGKFILEIF
jgi:probable ATP-dependent RNA helicase DDX4